jgi:hypothetical protein
VHKDVAGFGPWRRGRPRIIAAVARIPAEQSVVDATTASAKSWTKKFITAIYGALSDDTGDLIGSGLYLRANGRLFLVTAGHVINKGCADYADVVCLPKEGHNEALSPHWKISAPVLDLAVAEMGLSEPITSIAALTVDQLAGSSL